MKRLQASLTKKLESAARVAVLAVGSDLRGDDAAGLLAAEALRALIAKAPPRIPVDLFIGGATPENITGQIRRFAPSHLVILDAADFGGKPGDLSIIDPAAATSNMSGSTHGLPLAMLAQFLSSTIGCEVLLAGIQAASREMGAPVCPAVRDASERLAGLLAEALA